MDSTAVNNFENKNNLEDYKHNQSSLVAQLSIFFACKRRRSPFQVVYAAQADMSTFSLKKGKTDDLSRAILYYYMSEDLGYCLIFSTYRQSHTEIYVLRP